MPTLCANLNNCLSHDPSELESLSNRFCPQFPTVRRGLLLAYVGETTNDIFDILPSTGTTYTSAVQSLTQYFSPKTNKDVAIFEFRELVQSADESINNYYLNESNTLWFRKRKRRNQDANYSQDPRLPQESSARIMNLTALLSHGTSLEVTN